MIDENLPGDAKGPYTAERPGLTEHAKVGREQDWHDQLDAANAETVRLRAERDRLCVAVNALHDRIAKHSITGSISREWLLDKLQKITAGL